MPSTYATSITCTSPTKPLPTISHPTKSSSLPFNMKTFHMQPQPTFSIMSLHSRPKQPLLKTTTKPSSYSFQTAPLRCQQETSPAPSIPYHATPQATPQPRPLTLTAYIKPKPILRQPFSSFFPLPIHITRHEIAP